MLIMQFIGQTYKVKLMKLIDIVNARESLTKLAGQDIPFQQAYNLMKLIDKLNIHLDFYGKEVVKSGWDEERINRLNEFEIDDIPSEKVKIKMLDSVFLSASDIKALEPFIEFEE